MSKKLAVVILNFKAKKYVLSCIKSVLDSSFEDLEIFLVDNDSNDGLEDEIRKFEGLTFFQTGKNLGYSGGNNYGIKAVLDKGFEYVFILNPDTTVEKKTVEILLQLMEEYKADIVSPKIYFAGTKRIWYAGGEFDLANVLGSHKGVNEEDKGQYDRAEETDFATGAAMLVRSEVFERIGLFDERYFLYYEDSDLCYRAKRKGFKIMYIPEAVVYHANAKSTGIGSPLQDYYITRNRMLFASKFLSFRTRFALLREALKNIKNSSRRKALMDFATKNLGQGSFR